jgi:KaiC/GvpD/RAD55 family RecA-like ATPase
VSGAKKHEKTYDWVVAVEGYEKALTFALERNKLYEAAKIQERIGFCLHRAATQARNLQEFKSHMFQAFNSYCKAAKLFSKVEDPEKLARMYQCRAAASYVKSWLSPDSASRKRLLDECWKLEDEASTLYKSAGDHLSLGKTYNRLNTCLVDRLSLEWNTQTRQGILREALGYGEKAISILSKLGEKYELAKAYCTASICCHTAAEGLELEKKSQFARKALSYSRKAVELSEVIDDQFLLGMSSIWAGSAIIDFTDRSDSAARHFEKALECGTNTRDSYLIGRASYLLAHWMAWKMIAEEDPEKLREESKKCGGYSQDAISSFQSISNNQEVARSYYWYAENYSVLARSAETSLKKKRILLRKSIDAAEKGLEHAQRSGSADAVWLILHPLSKSLYLLSTIETDAKTRKQLLEKSLQCRKENIEALEEAMPYYFWNRGVYHNYLALVQAELAKASSGKTRRTGLLEDAVRSAESCIDLCLRSGTLSQGQYATLGRYYSDYGGILGQLHLMTGSSEVLGKLLEAFKRAAQTCEKADLPSRAAEGNWRLAKIHGKLQSYVESAEDFELAHEQYLLAANKICSLKDFYLNYASYMKGWSEIQKARQCHIRQQYNPAKKHYEKAATLHKSSKSWKYLASNYLAWAQLEQGEDLSRRERPEEAKGIFQRATELFAEAKKSIETRQESIEDGEEKEMGVELIKASGMRREYCLGRIALEDAKILDRRGEYVASSTEYGFAVKRFEKAFEDASPESDGQEFKPIVCLCRAWQMMMRAEAEASPALYLEASRFFDEAKEQSRDEKAKLLALGHSCFCKALEAGTRFEATRDVTLHSAATQHLEGAANFYFRAGFKSASEYAKATQRFFDAHMYMHKAKTEINPLQKAQYYQMSEKLLQASAGAYRKAKKPEKNQDVQRLLKSIEEERELALSLTEVLHAPAIMSTTTSFLMPPPTLEKAAGLERFEHASLQTDLSIKAREIRVGEDLILEMQITNVGKGIVLLAKVEGILPDGFELVAKPDYCHLQDSCLEIDGKRLDPLKTEKVMLVLRASNKGTFEMKPRIIYVDETGHQMVSEPKPATIEVLEVALPGRIGTGNDVLDDLLLGGIPENYSVILTSPSCDEKDLLIKRFLESGMRDGQVTFLVTAETSGVKTLAETSQTNFYVFICNPQSDTMVEDSPNAFRLKGVENLTEITIALTKALRTLDASPSGPRRACIGIVSDVLLQHHAVQTRRWLNNLLPELRSRGFTTLAAMNPQMHPPEEVQAMLELFDGEISIHERETKNGPEKSVKIKKMVNQRYLTSELPLRKERLKS